MTSHYTWRSVTTLHDVGGVLGRPSDTFFWALTISWSRLHEVALNTLCYFPLHTLGGADLENPNNNNKWMQKINDHQDILNITKEAAGWRNTCIPVEKNPSYFYDWLMVYRNSMETQYIKELPQSSNRDRSPINASDQGDFWALIIGWDPSVCKSNQLHVDILRFSFMKLGYILL